MPNPGRSNGISASTSPTRMCAERTTSPPANLVQQTQPIETLHRAGRNKPATHLPSWKLVPLERHRVKAEPLQFSRTCRPRETAADNHDIMSGHSLDGCALSDLHSQAAHSLDGCALFLEVSRYRAHASRGLAFAAAHFLATSTNRYGKLRWTRAGTPARSAIRRIPGP